MFKSYECNISTSKIVYYINNNNNEAFIETVFVDYVNIKAFMHLVKQSIVDLKNSCNIKYIKQQVTIQEWHDFLEHKTTWEIIDENSILETFIIVCNIDDFLVNFAIGLGL